MIDLENSHPSFEGDLEDARLEKDANTVQLTKKSTGNVTVRNKALSLI